MIGRILFFLGAAGMVYFIAREQRVQFPRIQDNTSRETPLSEKGAKKMGLNAQNRVVSTDTKADEDSKQIEPPDFWKTVFSESQDRIEREQGRLLRRLHLQPAVLELAKNISAASEADVALALKFDDPNESLEKTKQRIARMNAIEMGTQAALIHLLGPADYARYNLVQQEIACQNTVDRIADTMEISGVSPSFDQRDRILDAYTRATIATARIAGADPQLGDLSETERETLRKKQVARFDSVMAEEMSRSLDPDNFRAFMAAEYIDENGPH